MGNLDRDCLSDLCSSSLAKRDSRSVPPSARATGSLSKTGSLTPSLEGYAELPGPDQREWGALGARPGRRSLTLRRWISFTSQWIFGKYHFLYVSVSVGPYLHWIQRTVGRGEPLIYESSAGILARGRDEAPTMRRRLFSKSATIIIQMQSPEYPWTARPSPWLHLGHGAPKIK